MSQTERAALAAFMRGDKFAARLGIELLEMRPGYARAALTVEPHMVNGHNLPHGGAIFTLADFAFAVACNAHGRTAVALSMDIHFLSVAAVGEKLIAEAAEENLSRRTGLYRMTVTTEAGQKIAELHGMAYRKKTPLMADGETLTCIK